MEHWGGLEAVSKFYRFAELFKDAIAKNIIRKEDFFHDDDYVLDKIKNSGDSGIIGSLEKLKEKAERNMIGIIQLKKFRYIDPKILINGKMQSLSSIDHDFKTYLREQRRINDLGINI
jgi:hypothetical protein